jgi:hypothetical protein
MRALTIAMAASVGFALLGCGGGGSCAEGATKHEGTGLCMKLPADFKFDDKPMKAGETEYLRVKNTKTLGSFTIWLDKPEDLEKRAKIVENMASNDLKLVEKGDTSPGKGKFFHFHNGPGDYDFAVTLVSTSKHLYRCEIQNTKPVEAKPMVDACKTLSGP